MNERTNEGVYVSTVKRYCIIRISENKIALIKIRNICIWNLAVKFLNQQKIMSAIASALVGLCSLKFVNHSL